MVVAPSPVTGNVPLVTRLLTRWPQIAERMLAAGLGATPPAADLPDGHFTAEVLPTIYACGRAVLQAIGEQREFTRAEVAAFVVPVAERHAEDRFPLATLIEAIHGSAQSVLAEAAALATPEEKDELVTVGSRLLDLLMHINLTVVDTYTEVEQSIYNAEREARRELCTALLRGLPADELAARADTPLTDRYTVLAIHLRPDRQSTPAADLLARRRIRVLHRTLDALTNGTALVAFDGSAGIALLPNHSEVSVADAARYADLATDLTAQFGTPVFLAECRAVARPGLPEAAEQAAEVATLARLLDRPAGRYHLDDLLLEYQLTRPGPARDRLAQRIAPLLRNPHLLEALEAHLQFGSDRKAASARLHVHPNTFSYRLRRIAELTGIDPGEPGNSRMLAAALTIHRLYPAADIA
ncbi:helix-turn-helix domain-containing protein [Nocardia puris]|uniref:PucR-like helix-turn-helix protein n=1 Tax=Nocardia puris TaxID=208602 RepID=A0A366DAY5_9NOCA|nr:helix-turn-helix domain-containing protein [Nocardia puris]MBF6214084.1 helix-turn-helix domain-containing protein [Nocardia puris]MBF6368632.1 helix-turn-helix domain-containing protein [Nocardia puris]MBF6461534.1 helix-turn-helix domain-containing protein [Nocardia puris]RBO86594.1 PucR-like helix-turn-helix protein [Nocardia puris]